MKILLSDLVTKVATLFRIGNEDANKRFLEQIDALEALRDPARKAQGNIAVRARIKLEADKRGVEALWPDDRQTKELIQLPLSDIEKHLDIVDDDRDYGNAGFVAVYPEEPRESREVASRREAEYSRVAARLREHRKRRS
ncbi:MAG: hypothetical protein M3441_04095 [Chloroflexota bacterium]|nr:hypothetical protein [Chloroflexota bacterium]